MPLFVCKRLRTNLPFPPLKRRHSHLWLDETPEIRWRHPVRHRSQTSPRRARTWHLGEGVVAYPVEGRKWETDFDHEDSMKQKWTKHDSDVAYILKNIVWEWWSTWFWMCASSISRKCQSSHRANAAKTCKTMQCLLILFAGTESTKERSGDNRFSRFADFATLDDFFHTFHQNCILLIGWQNTNSI